jgi:hypothetical protein
MDKSFTISFLNQKSGGFVESGNRRENPVAGNPSATKKQGPQQLR